MQADVQAEGARETNLEIPCEACEEGLSERLEGRGAGLTFKLLQTSLTVQRHFRFDSP